MDGPGLLMGGMSYNGHVRTDMLGPVGSFGSTKDLTSRAVPQATMPPTSTDHAGRKFAGPDGALSPMT